MLSSPWRHLESTICPFLSLSPHGMEVLLVRFMQYTDYGQTYFTINAHNYVYNNCILFCAILQHSQASGDPSPQGGGVGYRRIHALTCHFGMQLLAAGMHFVSLLVNACCDHVQYM